MSVSTDCYGCAMGKHGNHDPEFGITPGLIGGQRCDCAGDCHERFVEMGTKILKDWGFIRDA